MSRSISQKLGKVIQIDEEQIHLHLGNLVRGTVEETLNKLLNAEANQVAAEGNLLGQLARLDEWEDELSYNRKLCLGR